MESAMSQAGLVMHPIRLRLLHALGDDALTPKQIAALVKGVAPATLYRQLKVLLEHGMIEVVEQRLVNGIQESVYRIKPGASHLTREQFAQTSPEEHKRVFAVCLGTMSVAIDSYFEQPDYDTTRDGMTYFLAQMRLTDDQRRRLRVDLLELMNRYAEEPDQGGRKTMVGVCLTPDESQ